MDATQYGSNSSWRVSQTAGSTMQSYAKIARLSVCVLVKSVCFCISWGVLPFSARKLFANIVFSAFSASYCAVFFVNLRPYCVVAGCLGAGCCRKTGWNARGTWLLWVSAWCFPPVAPFPAQKTHAFHPNIRTGNLQRPHIPITLKLFETLCRSYSQKVSQPSAA